MDTCTLCKELADDNHPGLLLETKHWRVVLSIYQSYVGRLFIMLREHKASLSDLSEEEWDDFSHLASRLENANRFTFSGTPFNWLSMMNDAYKNTPPNPHVHWHMIPRYDHEITVAGTLFTDPDFAHHYDKDRQQMISPEIAKVITQKLKAALER